jgi:hypothetical protein
MVERFRENRALGDAIDKLAAETGPHAVLEIPGDKTVFDDIALRLKRLTVEDLEDDDPGAIPGAFKIRIARTRGQFEATELIDRRYGEKGYEMPGLKRDPHLYTFCAYDEGELVGTVSIRLDSEKGLASDVLYRREVDQFRQMGQRVCEFTRLAVDAHVSKPVLAGLFHTAYLYAARLRGYDLAMIEVNPRHVAFYRRALGFKVVGDERMNERVNAPAVLLCVPFVAVSSGLRRLAGQADYQTPSHSLYSYGFNDDEETGVLRRLRMLERPANAEATPSEQPPTDQPPGE